MSENFFETLLLEIVNNWKKYLGCILGFIVGLTIIKYGLLKALVIFIFAFIGYKLGDITFRKKIKNKILNSLKED